MPLLYIDMDTYLPKLKLPADARSKALYGAHYITGRIIDLPLKGDYGEAESKAAGPVPENTGLAALGKLGYTGSLSLGSWVPDVMAHGGGREPALPANAAEREEWGKQGAGANHRHREADASAGSDGRVEEARRVHQYGARPEVRQNPAGFEVS